MAQRKLLYEFKAVGTISALSFSPSFIRVGVYNDQIQGSYSIKLMRLRFRQSVLPTIA